MDTGTTSRGWGSFIYYLLSFVVMTQKLDVQEFDLLLPGAQHVQVLRWFSGGSHARNGVDFQFSDTGPILLLRPGLQKRFLSLRLHAASPPLLSGMKRARQKAEAGGKAAQMEG